MEKEELNKLRKGAELNINAGIANQYKPTTISHPIETLKEFIGNAGMIDELTLSFFASRVDHYADYIAEKRLQEYIGMPFLCKFFRHEYKIIGWNKWFIPTSRKCARCGKEQEHPFSLANEHRETMWIDKNN